jgi:hypothetical protein
MGLNVGNTQSFYVGHHWGVNDFYQPYTQEPVGQWYHWVLTNGPAGSKMYLNSAEIFLNDLFTQNTTVAGTDLAIGVNVGDGIAPFANSSGGYFDGKIDDVRIYNRALSETEIQALYHEGGY